MDSAPMTSLERVPVKIFVDSEAAAIAVAERIAALIRTNHEASKPTVLGLATGHTPVNVYRELARQHAEEGLDLSGVITFNLDEYWPIAHDAIQSYHQWMQDNFFDAVNIRPENIHIPSGEVGEDGVDAFCRDYEKAIADAGGLDFQILGVGRSGHIGFNEPGSGRDSRTRRLELDKVTRMDAAGDFFGEENVPEMAITMGVGTIFDAREVALLAFGEHKAPICRQAVQGEVTRRVAASFLQQHPNVTFFLDAAAAADLTRIKTPWLLGPCEWDEALRRKAVIWLARKIDKPILKLTDEDYAENGLTNLRNAAGGAQRANLEVFRRLMNTITGWPGGKGESRRILILSPHPDDDVICMGGTMTRLVEQGHDVHVAYMVSGYLSVFDHDVLRYAEFAEAFNQVFGLAESKAVIEKHFEKFLCRKQPGDIDSSEVQAVKGLIRRGEARDAAVFCGMPESGVHYLDLPFYDTGKVQKNEIGPGDVEPVRKLYEAVKPQMIFAAGDMSDPHGTHRLCLQSALTGLHEYVAAGGERPEVWLYRGAWQEWEPEQIDRAVPLSPDELKHKRYAIFRHQSQKDRAMFPGPYDSREFWQRAEDRNMTTAASYDALGLPEYHAIEAFVRWPVEPAAMAAGQLEK